MSRNLGALTSWNPVGLFRPVMGHLYLYLYPYVSRYPVTAVTVNGSDLLAITVKVTLYWSVM
jgi:hypothetical protein